MDRVINKILLFGSTGMLGKYIYTYFYRCTDILIIPIDYRVTNESLYELEDILKKYEINEKTCVINCIGLIPQRKCKNSNNNEYFLINSIFPHLLSVICKKYTSKMIQPTTDCVFSGKRENGNYNEDDIHDENGPYGMSKSSGEPFYGTIIRTSIIGREKYNKKSFLEWVISNSDSNNSNINIKGWSNHYWNGITCLEYCKVIHKIINKNIFWNGVRHIFSPSHVSKYEMASMINDIFKLNIIIDKITCEIPINKTLSSKYSNNFQIKELYEQIKDLKDFELI
jgi:dTDP-4-dehydrorhamnose reductase